MPRLGDRATRSDREAGADDLIGGIRQAVGALDLHRIPRASHWSAYENAPEGNRLGLEFLSGWPGDLSCRLT